jgi:hypothetical protein
MKFRIAEERRQIWEERSCVRQRGVYAMEMTDDARHRMWRRYQIGEMI